MAIYCPIIKGKVPYIFCEDCSEKLCDKTDAEIISELLKERFKNDVLLRATVQFEPTNNFELSYFSNKIFKNENISDFSIIVESCDEHGDKTDACFVTGRYYSNELPYVATADYFDENLGIMAKSLAENDTISEQFKFNNLNSKGYHFAIETISYNLVNVDKKYDILKSFLFSFALNSLLYGSKKDEICSVSTITEDGSFFEEAGFAKNSKNESVYYLTQKNFDISFKKYF